MKRLLLKTSISFLGIVLFLALITLLPKAISKPDTCEVNNDDPQKGSIQTNNFYSSIFGSKSCAPKFINVKIPVAQKISGNVAQVNTPNPPEIVSIITFSNSSQSFYVKRIDETKSGLSVSKGDTCVAWKWSGDKGEQILNLSFQRNLQIYDPAVSKILFIISLPIELQKAGSNLSVERSVLEGSINSQAGEVVLTKLKDEKPNLSRLVVKQDTTPEAQNLQRWAKGSPISKELSNELISFMDRIAVYVDNPVHNIKNKSDKIESYTSLSKNNSCEIPNGL